MSQEPPWDTYGHPDSGQYQPYQGQPSYQGQPYQNQPPDQNQPPPPSAYRPRTEAFPPSQAPPPPDVYQPPTEAFPPSQAAPPPRRHRVRNILIASGGGLALLLIGIAIGAAGASKPQPAAAPTVTVTATAAAAPAPTVTATVTATPTANAQGQATQISQDGVYVVGTDIAGGTWHTSGGSQCYYATLSGTDPNNDIISNDNFTGPNTVDLSGAKAFDINGGCTWQHEG